MDTSILEELSCTGDHWSIRGSLPYPTDIPEGSYFGAQLPKEKPTAHEPVAPVWTEIIVPGRNPTDHDLPAGAYKFIFKQELWALSAYFQIGLSLTSPGSLASANSRITLQDSNGTYLIGRGKGTNGEDNTIVLNDVSLYDAALPTQVSRLVSDDSGLANIFHATHNRGVFIFPLVAYITCESAFRWKFAGVPDVYLT